MESLYISGAHIGRRLRAKITEYSGAYLEIGKLYKIDRTGSSSGFYIDNGYFFSGDVSEAFELVSDSEESLVGRYIKALVDHPQGGAVKAGEYGKITKIREISPKIKGSAAFPSQDPYLFVIYEDDDKYKIMPEGFNPGIAQSTSAELTCLPTKWIVKVESNSQPQEVADWRGCTWYSKGYIDCYKVHHSEISMEFAEISLDQFKKWVLKKEDPSSKTHNFQVGKWYKNLGYSQDYIAKLERMDGQKFISDGCHIYKGEYQKNVDSANCITSCIENAKECTLEEIQQYLPEGHPDKFSKQLSMTSEEQLLQEAKQRYPIGSSVQLPSKYDTTSSDRIKKIDGRGFFANGTGDIWKYSAPWNFPVYYKGEWAALVVDVYPQGLEPDDSITVNRPMNIDPIEEAARRYPSGCSYYPLSGDGIPSKTPKINVKYTGKPQWWSPYSTIRLLDGAGLVYADGEWAPLYEETPKKTSDKPGLVIISKPESIQATVISIPSEQTPVVFTTEDTQTSKLITVKQ